MPSIASVWTHLAWPATGLSGLRPVCADKDMWTVNFIDYTVSRAFVDDSPCAASDAQFEGLPFDARGSMHPRNLQKIWYVLSVVDLVEESFLVRVHVHARYKDIFGVDGHFEPPIRLISPKAREHPLMSATSTSDATRRARSIRSTSIRSVLVRFALRVTSSWGRERNRMPHALRDGDAARTRRSRPRST